MIGRRLGLASGQGPLHAEAPARVRIPTNLNTPIWTGLLLIGVGLGGFLLWAALAPLDQGIVAQGTVTVDSSRKTVQHLKGGIVQRILVRNGDRVSAGQTLLTLDDTQVKAEMGSVLSQYLALRGTAARLFAERDGAAEIQVPEDLRDLVRQPEHAAVWRAQTELFETRRRALAGEISIHKENIAGLEEQVAGLKKLEAGKARQVQLLEEQLKALRAVLEKGYVARVQLFELERTLADVTGSRGEDLGTIARTQKSISEAKLKILQIQQDHLKDVETQLETVQRELGPLRERLAAARDDLERLAIKSPDDGFVMGKAVSTEGGVIGPGQALMYIVPDGDAMTLDIQVQPQDIDKVHTGLPVDVRLTAFNRSTTPIVTGEVTMVSADRMLEERTGLPYYAARVKISPAGMAKLDGLQIQPGMPADVIVRTGERTFLAYLWKPVADRFARSLKEE